MDTDAIMKEGVWMQQELERQRRGLSHKVTSSKWLHFYQVEKKNAKRENQTLFVPKVI